MEINYNERNSSTLKEGDNNTGKVYSSRYTAEGEICSICLSVKDEKMNEEEINGKIKKVCDLCLNKNSIF